MTTQFRVIYHDAHGKPHVLRPANEAEDTDEQMTVKLEHYVEKGLATGGHIETYVDGIGWVVSP